jgi:DNA-binding XRE family transcriptional regulator
MSDTHKTIERGGRTFVLVPQPEYERLTETLEDREDVRAYDRAKAKAQEKVPATVADRLIAGENPIRVWREHRAATLQLLADRTRISKPYLSQIENGRRAASIGILQALARALRVDLEDLAPANRPRGPGRRVKRRGGGK